MTIRKRLTILLLSALAFAALALPASAKDKTVTIIDDDGTTYVCTFVDGEFLRVVDKETGESVLDFDMAEVEATIEEAMAEVGEALAELEDLEFDFHFGDESYFRFEKGDEKAYVDLDGIMAAVMGALEGLEDMEIHVNDLAWNDDGEHERHDRMHEQDRLEHELRELRDEVRRLKRELRESERRRRH